MDLTCEHNLSPEEMTKALRGLAEAEGISEELSKALRRSSVDLTPKVPADPFARRIYEQMMAAFEKAAADIERYAEHLITPVVRYGSNRFNMRDIDIETDKLERWQTNGSN